MKYFAKSSRTFELLELSIPTSKVCGSAWLIAIKRMWSFMKI